MAGHFRTPGQYHGPRTALNLSPAAGYFTFEGIICYGRVAGVAPARSISDDLPKATAGTDGTGAPVLPFDLREVVTNLQQERYRRSAPQLERIAGAYAPRRLYYLLRPLLPVRIRRHLQKIHLTGWDRIQFPHWPVDVTVEKVMRRGLAQMLGPNGETKIPFIWFWPEGAPSCAMVTHDVEGPDGRDFCDRLMDIDKSFDIPSAFQIIPEMSSDPTGNLMGHVRSRGFEVNLHDLNHDGYLFENRRTFLVRAAEINRYARELQCRGFRSGSMYREQQWYDSFEFSFDMSVPNVAHLEPQRGGCCTVMPYFVGNILELPLTLTQDYSLFHILGEYSTRLWKEQIDLVMQENGLISAIVHPDYLTEARSQQVYREVLEHLSRLRAEQGVWIAPPAEIDRWWRNRRQMTLVRRGDAWQIEGPDSQRARLAYAVRKKDALVYEMAPPQ